MVGDDIVVEIVEVRGNRVRIAIEAPQYVAIARAELLDAMAEHTRRQERQLQRAG